MRLYALTVRVDLVEGGLPEELVYNSPPIMGLYALTVRIDLVEGDLKKIADPFLS